MFLNCFGYYNIAGITKNCEITYFDILYFVWETGILTVFHTVKKLKKKIIITGSTS